MTTWNPSDKSTTITLTNGNLTATSSTAVSQSVRSTTSKSSGKVYWEITIGTKTNDIAFGLANSTEPLNISSGIGGDANAAGFYSVSPPQALYVGGSQLYQGSTASVNGEVVKFACDFGTSPPTIWVLDSKMTGWNNSGTANPSTSTGGQSLTGLNAGPYFAIFNDDLGGASCTVNFGASSFSGTVPTGFSSWDLASVTGTISATTKKPTASISGGITASGTISATTRKPTSSISGLVNFAGTISATTRKPTASVTGKVNFTGTISATTRKPSASLSGTLNESGTITATTRKPTASLTAAFKDSGTIAATTRKPTASLTATFLDSGTISATTRKPTASLSGNVSTTAVTGTISGTTRKPTSSMTGRSYKVLRVSAKRGFPFIPFLVETTNGVDAAHIDGSYVVSSFVDPGMITATTKKPTANIAGVVQPVGTISATTRKPTASLTGKLNEAGTITATTRKPTASITGKVNVTGTISATTRKPTVSINSQGSSIVSLPGPGDSEDDPKINVLRRFTERQRRKQRQAQAKALAAAKKAHPKRDDPTAVVAPAQPEPTTGPGLNVFADVEHAVINARHAAEAARRAKDEDDERAMEAILLAL